jgi:hypothetical protein
MKVAIFEFIEMIDDLAEILIDRDGLELKYQPDREFNGNYHLTPESQSDYEDYNEEAEAILRKIGIGREDDLDPNEDIAEGTMGWEQS